MEFTVYPLFSPMSLIAEGAPISGSRWLSRPGTAEVRTGSTLPAGRPRRFAGRKVLRVLDLINQLGYAGNEAARRYLDGELTADQAVDWMVKYQLSAGDRARQRLHFVDQYRSYVINYNLGKDLVRQHVEANGGTVDHPDRRWQVFADLLSSPRLPSELSK